VGNFRFNAAYTHKTKFDQFFGATGEKFSVLGTAGFNTTFPSVEDEGRLNLGYEAGGFNGNLFFNYLGGYRNWSGSSLVPIVRVNGFPTDGGDKVKSFTTIDANIAYTFSDVGMLDDVQVFLDATNLLDEDPPQYNVFAIGGNNGVGVAGYDPVNANPLGRVITVGFRTKF
jgi:iron complex outermembrane receptor protein